MYKLKNSKSMKKLVTIYTLFGLVVCILLCSCKNDKSSKNDKSDLSFAGITIGQDFPDSLKNNNRFKYYEHSSEAPSYDGSIPFSLPNYPNAVLDVAVTTDLDGKEVTSIEIVPSNDEASDLYDMLKSKYGIPTSNYGDADCSLNLLINNMYEDLGYSEYNCKTDITGTRVIAQWEPISSKSIIRMIARTLHFPNNSYSQRLHTYIWFQYINLNKFTSVQAAAERKAINKKREDYRKQNQKAMNQDF